MALLELILQNFFSFVAIISLIVFVHEFGHFYVARLCGVKVDEFAIGFGRELWGFRDKKGTRWKICLLPLGGYVKMHGDRNGASIPDFERIKHMSKEEKKKSFVGQNVYQRMAIVSAGPVSNLLLAIVIFTILFRINGLNTVLPIVDAVMPESAAFAANIQKGDKVVAIDNKEIKDFEDIRAIISASNEKEMLFKIRRNDNIIEIKITPKIQLRKDFFGDDVKMPTIGIAASQVDHQNLSLGQSFAQANIETYDVSIAIFKTIGELIVGQKSVKELGGPIKIAKYSGKTVQMGMMSVLWFMAMISINLGVMNILPVPVLDGGHLFYYIIEAVRGKALSPEAQRFGFRIGLILILTLMAFTTVNDVVQIFSK